MLGNGVALLVKTRFCLWRRVLYIRIGSKYEITQHRWYQSKAVRKALFTVLSSSAQHSQGYTRSPPIGNPNTLEKHIPPQPFLCKTRCWAKIIEFTFEFRVIFASKLGTENFSHLSAVFVSGRRSTFAWRACVASRVPVPFPALRGTSETECSSVSAVCGVLRSSAKR